MLDTWENRQIWPCSLAACLLREEANKETNKKYTDRLYQVLKSQLGSMIENDWQGAYVKGSKSKVSEVGRKVCSRVIERNGESDRTKGLSGDNLEWSHEPKDGI